MRESRRYLTALRRGVALGLVLAGLWGAGQLAGFSGLGDRLASLGRAPGLTRALLARQLGPLPGDQTDALEGWGRLLLGQSPLLAAGEE